MVTWTLPLDVFLFSLSLFSEVSYTLLIKKPIPFKDHPKRVGDDRGFPGGNLRRWSERVEIHRSDPTKTPMENLAYYVEVGHNGPGGLGYVSSLVETLRFDQNTN
jgi:hypothetical protein